MQRGITALLLVGLVGGCTTRAGAKIGMLTAAGVLSVGVAMQVGALGPGGATDPEDYAFIPLTLGMLILLPSLYVSAASKDDGDVRARQATDPHDPKASRRAADRDQAWQLTKQAMEASRADDCPTVSRLEASVRALDADFYATIFVRDAGIIRCLTPSAASSTPAE